MRRFVAVLAFWGGVAAVTSVIASDSVQAATEGETPEITSHAELLLINDAWTTRQEAVRSVRVEWEPNRSGINRWSSYQTAWRGTSQDVSGRPSDRFCIIGDRFRYQTVRWHYQIDREFSGFNGSPDDPEHFFPLDERSNRTSESSFFQAIDDRFRRSADQFREPRHFTRTFDGSIYRDHFSALGDLHAEAAIYRTEGGPWPEDLLYRPVLLAFRPFSRLTPVIDLERCHVVQDRCHVNGFDCLVLEEHHENDVVRRYFIDPKREYVVVRQIERHGPHPAAQFDIDYADDPEHGWVPSGWTSILMRGSADVQDYPGRDEVFQFVSVGVADLTFNDDVEDGGFDTSFPAGTVVNDQVHQKHYLIGKNGDHVHLTRDDLFEVRSAATHRFSWQGLSLRAKILSVAMGLFLAAAAVKLSGRIIGGAGKVGLAQDVDDAHPS